MVLSIGFLSHQLNRMNKKYNCDRMDPNCMKSDEWEWKRCLCVSTWRTKLQPKLNVLKYNCTFLAMASGAFTEFVLSTSVTTTTTILIIIIKQTSMKSRQEKKPKKLTQVVLCWKITAIFSDNTISCLDVYFLLAISFALSNANTHTHTFSQ